MGKGYKTDVFHHSSSLSFLLKRNLLEGAVTVGAECTAK